MTETIRRTPLYDLHIEYGAQMVPFAGYEMPVRYRSGILKEHLHTRQRAGLFDISHMGQIELHGASYNAVAVAFQKIVPMEVMNVAVGRQKYGFFTTDNGGIKDDIIFSNRGDHIYVVVNAACTQGDLKYLRSMIEPGIKIQLLQNKSLLSLQGPDSEFVLSKFHPGIKKLKFMDTGAFHISGVDCWISRSGYTGEDGFEISIPTKSVVDFARELLSNVEVELIGIGARDSLRLEAGLCLYGQDIDENTSPVEAGLGWVIKGNIENINLGNTFFPGREKIFNEIKNGTERIRVGLKPDGRAPMRAGTPIFKDLKSCESVGMVTSGGFGPTIGGPVAMGYLDVHYAKTGNLLYGEVRGKRLPVKTVDLPFTKLKFKR